MDEMTPRNDASKMSHGGAHVPGSCGCPFDPGYLDEESRAREYTLNEQLVVGACVVVNSCEASSRVVADMHARRFAQRRDAVFVTSDVDDDLLFVLTFSGRVAIKALMIVAELGANNAGQPTRVDAYVDARIDDFDAADSHTPTQTWTLTRPDAVVDGESELATNFARFSALDRLSLRLRGRGVGTLALRYLGLRGVAVGAKGAVDRVRASVEIRAQLKDHTPIAGTRTGAGAANRPNF